MSEYQHDKEGIVAYQKPTDILLVNADNSGAVMISKAASGQVKTFSATDVSDWESALPGSHNRENLAAMSAVAQVLGISEDLCRQVAKDFRGLPFRQEIVHSFHGVNYVNDTTATTSTAAIKALQAATTPLIWITGGDTKKLPFDELIHEVKVNHHLKQIIILGSKNIPDYTSALTQIAGGKIAGTVTSMAEAVELAGRVADPGDTVLLSPGFASFDLFQNEFDRGRQFNELVKALA
jgi:UDP-N-acetylmuramoylalanine--D-glutamate ligase